MPIDFANFKEKPEIKKVDFSLMDKEAPPDFMVDKTNELAKISGDDPAHLKEKINSIRAFRLNKKR